jgi:ABC-type transporter Mla subunit MlaD
MKKIWLTLLAVIMLGAAGFGLWQLYLRSNSVTVVFADAGGVVPGTGVWMAGIEVGRVLGLQVAGDGVEMEVFLGREVRAQLTENALFVIDPGTAQGGRPVLRVKAGAGGTAPLAANARLQGVNSFTLWQLDDYSQKVLEFMNEPQLQEGIKRLEQFGKELKK